MHAALTEQEALVRAEQALRVDAAVLGAPVEPGPGAETPDFWVFRPNSARWFHSRSSTDSMASDLPPVVVDRRDGRVTRPFAAGASIRAADLGEGQWFILAPRAKPRPGPDGLDGLSLTEGDMAKLRRLRCFRFQRGVRNDGDQLVATLVAVDPAAISPGFQAAGFTPVRGGWIVDGLRVVGSVDTENASARLSLTQDGGTTNSWTVGPLDVGLAVDIEKRLAEAPWVRFWL